MLSSSIYYPSNALVTVELPSRRAESCKPHPLEQVVAVASPQASGLYSSPPWRLFYSTYLLSQCTVQNVIFCVLWSKNRLKSLQHPTQHPVHKTVSPVFHKTSWNRTPSPFQSFYWQHFLLQKLTSIPVLHLSTTFFNFWNVNTRKLVNESTDLSNLRIYIPESFAVLSFRFYFGPLKT